MTYQSNKLIYLSHKYTPLFGSGALLFFAVDFLLRNYNESGVEFIVAFFLILSSILFYYFIFLCEHLVEIELSNKSIYIKKHSIPIEWLEVLEIKYTWSGLYRIKTEEYLFYFAPFDLPISVFGYKINTDEFDLLIERKKKELKI